MKVILLVLIVFLNGQSQTAALIVGSEEECKLRIEKMREAIAENNGKSENRIAYYAMECAEPVIAPRGPDS